jgi:hypothetical protein
LDSPLRREQPHQLSRFLTPKEAPQEKTSRTGCLIRQPFATDSRQLNLRRMIIQANRHPGHAA